MAEPAPSPSPHDYAIDARGLKKAFGPVVALRGVDLKIEPGVFYVLLGPNGAGKTTLMRALATLSTLSAGELHLLGRPAKGDPKAIRRELGVISHQLYLFPHLSASENLHFYGRLYGLEDLKAKVPAALEEVELLDVRDRLVKTFSRGMQQRLSIARALLPRPSLVLLDEPFTGLDQQSGRALSQLLMGLKDGKRTFVMITHNLPFASELGDRAGFLLRGRLEREIDLGDYDLTALTDLYREVTG